MNALLLDATVSSLVHGSPQLFSVLCLCHGANQAELVPSFEKRLAERYAESEWPTQLEKTDSYPVFDQSVTETGLRAVDFAEISQLSGEPASYEEAGLWENCHELVPVGMNIGDLEAFQRSLPADAASALNWDPAKQLIFLIRVFGEAEDASQDLVVIAQARNAPAAAWSWRFHGRSLDESRRPIRVEGICPVLAFS